MWSIILSPYFHKDLFLSFLPSPFPFMTHARVLHTQANTWGLPFWAWVFSLAIKIISCIYFPENFIFRHWCVCTAFSLSIPLLMMTPNLICITATVSSMPVIMDMQVWAELVSYSSFGRGTPMFICNCRQSPQWQLCPRMYASLYKNGLGVPRMATFGYIFW